MLFFNVLPCGLPGGQGVIGFVGDGAESLQPRVNNDDFTQSARGVCADQMAAVRSP